MSEIIGSKGGGSQHTHYEAPDSLHSISYARVLDLVSEGEIAGLAEGLQSVFLNGTPVQNADGTSNFTGVTVDFRTGTQTQDYIPGFPDVENEVGVNTELKSSAPWVHAISNLALSAIRVTLGVPALSQTDTTNGDIKGYKIDYKIELAKDGGAYATVLTSSFNGKTTTAYQRTARIDLPAATTGWQIRVTRLTANAGNSAIADTTTVISYAEVIDAKLRYPMSAIVGVQVDAKQFQSVPTRSYDLMGRIVQVPSNYNAKTRAYTGTWDGTFKPSWSDNPAWVFRDIALNDRYGLGNRITAAQLDKWSLYAIARYCDGMVPDGMGGTEPRFTCNVYIQAQKDAYAVLQDLASVFRGISYWGAGTIIASADMPVDPVYVYTAANVIGGKFSRVGSSKKTRYTTALVSWNDPADSYKAKVEYVEDAEGITRYGIQQVSLTAFGCASQGQAHRVGKWALATSRLETEMISFDVGMDGAMALPGQVVRVADPSRMGRRNGGRIKAASGRVLVLDKAPTINAGDKLTAILPTGVSETHKVVSIAGDSVTVDADWSTLPIAQSVWSVDSTALIAPTYKIVSVAQKDSATYTISATQHEPGKYDFVELGIAITPRPETALNAAVQQPPAAVTVAPYTVSLADVQKLGFTASCAPVDGAVAYEGAFQADNGNWFDMPRQSGPTFDILDVLAGYYTVRIAAVNSLGIASIPTVSAPTLVNKNANPKNAGILLTPSAQGFNVNADGSITPASITVHADLLALDGIVTWAAVGATITSSNNNATITAANMPGAAMTLTATIVALGQTFTRSIDIVKSADGAAGAANYTWIKYGTSAAGAGLTDNPAGMTYIGLAFNRSSPTESTVATDYTWSKISGADGSAGASVFVGVAYLQAAAAPATPTGGTFNFTTLALTPPTGWSATQPASSTTPTWAVRYTFAAPTIGATVTAGAWSTPTTVSQNGAAGAAAPQTMLVFLYQWNAATPAAPNGTSTLNWLTGANGSYNGTDTWAVAAPANPGAPGLRLYVATQSVTAPGGTTSTAAISYANASISPWATNGTNGSNGAQAAKAIVYQWAATIPAGPSGSASLTWSTGLFGDAPAGWALAPGAPVAGYTLWAASASLIDTAAATKTSFNWTSAGVMAIGYAGGNGQSGASYVTAYCASVTGNATSAPAATAGKTSLPAANSGGIVGTWSSTVPTLTAGQYQYQSDGIYDPSTGNITWSIPYWSSLKVGTLAAITANLGAINAGSINLGNGVFTVDNAGNLVCSSIVIKAPNGTVLFTSNAGLTAAAAAPGTLNSDLTASITAAQNAANAANTAIGIAAADGWLDKGEKPRIITEFSTIDGERTGIANSAAAVGVDAATYQATINTLATYLSSLGPTAGDWSNLSVDSPWDGAFVRARFADVYNARQAVLNAVAAKIQANALAASNAASVADGKAVAASSAAAAAQNSANTANTIITAITNDNVLDRSEKPRIITEFTAIDAQRAGITTSASDLGLSPADYQHKCDNLAAYLSSLGPGSGAWSNVAVDSPMDGPFLRDRFTDVYNARQVLLNAIAAKIQTNAAAAATTSTWAGTTGAGKPADNATVGATFGANIYGQITAATASTYVAPKAFTQTQFGGDISSDNWNGFTDSRGRGWYGQRDTGSFFLFNLYSRGALMGGSFTGFSWPSDNAPGFYLGPEGLLLGSANTGKYAFMAANGDVGMNGFSYTAGQLTLTSPIIITPQVRTSFAASIPGINTRNQVNSNSYQSFGTISASTANGVAPFRYQWSFSVESGDIKMVGDPSASSVQIQARGTNVYSSAYLLLVITDVNGAQTSAAANIVIQFGSGVPQ